MSGRERFVDAPKYVVGALDPIPKYWRDHIGELRVMTREPVEGWLMVRRLGAAPFILRLAQLLNAEAHHTHGPFIVGRESKKEGASK